MEVEPGFVLVKQGAEGRLFRGMYLGQSTMIKERFRKAYRHPQLDENLTKERMKAEARIIVRCKAAGIRTPTLYLVDFERRRLYMEDFTDAVTVKKHVMDVTNSSTNEEEAVQRLQPVSREIGSIIGRMHANNIIHGDLTSSNMLLIKKDDGSLSIVFIDFGLGYVEGSAEDKGVDLYVLERALLSTHSVGDKLFQSMLKAYKAANSKSSKEVVAKFEEVRARGRKRTMVG